MLGDDTVIIITIYSICLWSNNFSTNNILYVLSDFIWDFGKLPFPVHLGKYFIKIGKVSAKIHELVKIKAIF